MITERTFYILDIGPYTFDVWCNKAHGLENKNNGICDVLN